MPAAATPSSDTAVSSSPVSLEAKAKFWNRIARKYAADPIADLGGYEKTLARTQGLLTADMEVLEVGCGTGTTALHLAPGVRRMLAIDVSPAMIAIARERLVDQGAPNLEFRVADADAPWPGPGGFDAVLAFNLLHVMQDLPLTLRAIASALKPGGLFISKTACIRELHPLLRLALPLMRAVGKAPTVLCFNTAELQAAIEQQGLDIVAVEGHATRGREFRPYIVARKPG